jgi:hypothetical protein
MTPKSWREGIIFIPDLKQRSLFYMWKHFHNLLYVTLESFNMLWLQIFLSIKKAHKVLYLVNSMIKSCNSNVDGL